MRIIYRWLKVQGLALMIAAGIVLLPLTAEAKVVAYVTKGSDDELYEFDYNELVRAFVFSSSTSQPLYQEFLKGETKYLLDDENGYVDYYEAVRAFVFSSGNFNLDAYTSGPDAKIVTVDVVNAVTVEDGKLKFTRKIITDLVEIALAEVNAADDASHLRDVLEREAILLGLSLNSYNQLSNYGKTLAATGILQRRQDGFADAAALKLVFDEEVQALLANPVAVAMHEANSVSDAASLRNVLEANASLLTLDLSEYNQLLEHGKTLVFDNLFQNRGDGFADAVELKSAFYDELAAVKQIMQQYLDSINSAEGLDELEQLLLTHGEDFGLELDAFNLIISTRKQVILSQVFDSKPYESAQLLRNEFNAAVAQALRSYVIISYTDYNFTIPEMVSIQMSISAKPQRWVSGGGWRNATASEVQTYVDPANFVLNGLIDHVTEVIVATSNLRIRELPSTEGERLGYVQTGQVFVVEDVQRGLEGTAPGTEGYWFKITTEDVSGWIYGQFVDLVAEEYSTGMFQFLNLSGPSGATVTDLGIILAGKGILSGTEETFYQAARDNNINEIFLTSLALHESGNGGSTLANGQEFNGRIVYNMFGIGAYDSNPNYYGAQRAYNEGWFTPEAAIIGGAVFASSRYVNHPSYKQDTLYKMRWNPGNPGTHQYATDVAWATGNQTRTIRDLYALVNIYNLRFDVPRYKPENQD